jgi:tyrosyl-tRNA synthetase
MTRARTSSSVNEQIAVLSAGAAELISEKELSDKLHRKGRLRVKAGFDPTAADLHLGHTVVMHKLRQFQDLGHEVIFLIGDFTARIGDPSGRSDTRPVLDLEAIKRNAETYQQQAFKILDRERTQVEWNGAWMDQLRADDVIRLASEYTVARMLERDDFHTRYKSGQPIGVHEFLYPLIQGHDSVVLRADVEIGGTDQKFNLLVGRELQRSRGLEPQVVLMMPLLEGLDGVQKMSKSLGNFVGLTDPPAEMYGKIMSISDELMLRYYALLSRVDRVEVEAIRSGREHPMQAKKRLAAELVERYHGAACAVAAAREFERRFQHGQLPDDIPEFVWSGDVREASVLRVMKDAGLTKSLGEARRLILQGGVRVNGTRATDPNEILPRGNPLLIQIGKRRFVRVRFPRQ